MADGHTNPVLPAIAAKAAASARAAELRTDRPRYRCCNCKAPAMLCELNDDMKCIQCGEPDEDPDGVIDTSDAEMRREHGFYV